MRIYIYVLLVIFTFSCTSTKIVHNPPKDNITGSWKLTTINQSDNVDPVNTPLFDVEIVNCLEGSVWNFNADKTSGTIEMNGSNCLGNYRKIHWLIYEPGDGTMNFQFKYISTGEEAEKNISKGYQTKIDKIDGSTMVMHTVSGKESNSAITLTFNKITP